MIDAIRNSSPGVLLIRVLLAGAVVFATYNPTGTSIVHWIMEQPSKTDAWVVLVAIVTILVHIGLLIAAWKALDMIGTVIAVIFFGAIIYLSLQEGWVSAAKGDSLRWMALSLYSVFLGIGLSGAILWRRATGQVVTDEADDL